MRAIGRMAAELLGVLLAGVASFFAAIGLVVGALFVLGVRHRFRPVFDRGVV